LSPAYEKVQLVPENFQSAGVRAGDDPEGHGMSEDREPQAKHNTAVCDLTQSLSAIRIPKARDLYDGFQGDCNRHDPDPPEQHAEKHPGEGEVPAKVRTREEARAEALGRCPQDRESRSQVFAGDEADGCEQRNGIRYDEPAPHHLGAAGRATSCHQYRRGCSGSGGHERCEHH
jgi:hypothetical protein